MQKKVHQHTEQNTSYDVGSMSKYLKRGFGFILFLILLLACVNIYQLQKTKKQLNSLVSTNIEKMTHVSIMRDSIRLRTISLYNMLQMDDYFERDEELLKFYGYAQRYVNARIELHALGVSNAEKNLNEKINARIKISQPITRNAAGALIFSNLNHAELMKKVSRAVTSQEELYTLLNELNKLQENQSKQTLDEVNTNFTYTILLTIIVTIIVTFLSLQIAIRLYRHVIITSKILTKKNIDLESAYIKAEESTKIKSEFLARMSHEIRTPMNGVMGMLQLLSIGKLNAQQKNYADMALSSSESLLYILDDILDFSKIEAGKLNINNIPFSLTSTMNHVIEIQKNSALLKDIKLYYSVNSDVEDQYIGDAHRLSQILNNLISNAIKFTENGEVKINISLNESDDDSSILYTEICDSGIGITDENKIKLFTSFNQADNSTSRLFGGTGLGLAICKQLSSLMGGDIGIYDGKNGGSVFWFTVKLARVKDQKNTLNKYNLLPDSNTKEPISSEEVLEPIKKKILIVEDKEINQKVAVEILKTLNYLSDIAESGIVAIEKTQNNNYDLILMDCHMPYMDGFEATHKIRKLQKEGKVSYCPIIALSGDAMAEGKDKCLEAGMDDFLAKPFRIKEISTMIEKWLKKNQLSN